MISPDFIIHNKTFTDRLKFLDSRTVIQLGSSDKEKLANAILLLQAVYGSKLKVNLNCGCPSTRVQSGNFGAILMKSNKLVVEIINHVYEKTGIVLSLKIRIGVDDLDSYDFFKEFVLSIVENTPCRIFFVHARKCWLNGISPHQNRNIPPLNYEFVEKLRDEINIAKIERKLNKNNMRIASYKSKISNEGVVLRKNLDKVEIHLNGGLNENNFINFNFDGLMFGRRAIEFPFIFRILNEFLGDNYADEKENFYNKNKKSGTADVKKEIEDLKSKIDNTYKIEILDNYFKFLPNEVKYFHLAPIFNFLKGERNGKKFRKFLNDALNAKIEKNRLLDQIKKFFK